MLNHVGIIAMGAALAPSGSNQVEGYQAVPQMAGIGDVSIWIQQPGALASQIYGLLSSGPPNSASRARQETSAIFKRGLMMSSRKRKVLAIGIDACDIDYLRAYLPALPQLGELLSAGRLLRLQSTAEVLDASVWPTFITGKLPGSHGYYFPLQWNQEFMRYDRVKSRWLPLEPFWNSLAQENVRVGVFDMPMLPTPVNSSEAVSYYHWHSQDERKQNDTTLGQKIRSKFGRNPLGYDIPTDKTARQAERINTYCQDCAIKRGKISRWLMENSAWDLFITCFSELHRAGHYLCPNPNRGEQLRDANDKLVECYKAVDSAITEIISAVDLGTTHLVMFSLHGMGANNSQAHFVPKILDRMQSRELDGQPQRSLTRLLREKLPAQVQQPVARMVSQAARDRVVNSAFSGGIDWKKTSAFAIPTGGQGYIRLNVRGRESQGIVHRDGAQYEAIVENLKRNLVSLRDTATGNPLVKDVFIVKDTFRGELADRLPDISVVWNDLPPATLIHSDQLGTFAGKLGTGRPGNHRPNAFVWFNASASEQLFKTPEHIVDLPVTIRHLLTH